MRMAARAYGCANYARKDLNKSRRRRDGVEFTTLHRPAARFSTVACSPRHSSARIRSPSLRMDNDTHESSSGPVRPEPSPGRAAPDGVARVSRAPTVPEDIRPLLASAWLLEGEDPGLFERLLAEVGDAIRPIDIIDWIYVMDVVARTWEIQRSRRHRESLMRLASQRYGAASRQTPGGRHSILR